MKIGIDIEEISRFENKTLEADKPFLERVYTEGELQYSFLNSNPAKHLCGRFCAKEALIKAMSDRKISLNKIEVLNDENGKPHIKLLNCDIQIEAEVSISHCKSYACATVLLLNVKKN